MNHSENYPNEAYLEEYIEEQKSVLKSKVEALLASYRSGFRDLKIPISVETLIQVMKDDVSRMVIKKSPYSRSTKDDGNKWEITIPDHFHRSRTRLEVAHEIAHILLDLPQATDRLLDPDREDVENEVIEYGARLILMPSDLVPPIDSFIYKRSIAEEIVKIKHRFEISAHATIRRLFQDFAEIRDFFRVQEVIIWKIYRKQDDGKYLVTPGWKLSTGKNAYFVPIGKCFAKEDSSAYRAVTKRYCVRLEDVRIGGLKGRFVADSAGYWPNGDYYRRIISVFRKERPGEYPLFEKRE